MGYAVERARRDNLTESYRIYVTDSLRSIPQMAYLDRRWTELVNPAPPIDADAIIENLVEKLGGEE